MTPAEEELETLKEDLRKLLAKVPSNVMSAGATVTQQFLADAEVARKALNTDYRTRVREAIVMMDVWWRSEIPHHHPVVK